MAGFVVRTKSFYWNDDDRRDQQLRRSVNADQAYTENSNCEFCGALLCDGAFQCATHFVALFNRSVFLSLRHEAVKLITLNSLGSDVVKLSAHECIAAFASLK